MKVFFFMLIGLVSSFTAYAGCSPVVQTTPFMEGNPGITALGNISFSTQCQLGENSVSLDWEWEYEGQVQQGGGSFSINPSTSGEKFVTFRAVECSQFGGCGGGTSTYAVYAAKRPTVTVSQNSGCEVNYSASFGYLRSVNISSMISEVDTTAIGQFINWETLSTPAGVGGFSWLGGGESAVTMNAKGTASGRAVAGVNYPKASGSFPVYSAPKDLSVSCPNLPPDLLQAAPNVPSGQVGSGVGFFFQFREPDAPVGDTVTYKVAASGPAGIVVESPNLANLLFVPSHPGTYQLQLSLTDQDGATSEIKTATFEATGNVAKPNFKVLLGGQGGKEYLFDTCAPHSDPCKQWKDSHKGGEFLLKDQVTFDASDNEGGLTKYIWDIGPAVGPPQRFEDVSPTRAFAFEEAGDYSITLTVEKNGEPSLPETKLVKVQEKIEIAFQDDGAVTVEKPYPLFYQGDYVFDPKSADLEKRNKWHRNGGDGLSLDKAGCTVTSLSMLARIKEWEGKSFTPASFNQYLAEQHQGFQSGDVLWGPVVNAFNGIQNGDPVLFQPADPFTQISRSALEHYARKRKLMIIKVHSRGHGPTDDHNSSEFSDDNISWAKNCRERQLSISKCHEPHHHFMVVRGLGYFGEDNLPQKRRILLADPGQKSRKTFSLDHSRLNQQQPGYDGDYRGVAVFTPEDPPPIRPFVLAGRIQVSVSGGESGTLLTNPAGLRLGIDPSNGESFTEIADGSRSVSGLSADREDSSGETVSEGEEFSVPGANGLFRIKYKFGEAQSFSGAATLLSASGVVQERKFFRTTGSAGALGQLEFSFSEGTRVDGNFSVSKAKFFKRSAASVDQEEIHGALELGPGSNGFNFALDDFSFLIGSEGDTVPAEKFRRVGTSWLFAEAGKLSGITMARISDDGTFSLKARGMTDLDFSMAGPTFVEIRIGDDRFRNKIQLYQSAKPMLSLSFDKFLYSVGQKANMVAQVENKPKNPEVELVPALYKGGEELFPVRESGQRFEYSTTLSESGTIEFEGRVFLQNKRAARALTEAMRSLRREKAEIEHRLDHGVDEATKVALEKRLLEIVRNLESLRVQLAKIRTQVGDIVREEIYVD